MTTIPPSIFKSYDIRGTYPDQINENNLPIVVKAVAYFLKEIHTGATPMTIVIGHDMRLSAPSLYPILRDTLVDAGIKVVDIGLSSTPTFYFAVFHYGYDCGVQLTASHNPSQYTGMKIVKNTHTKGFIKIGKSTGMETIKEYALKGVDPSSKTKGSITKKINILDEEINHAASYVELSSIKPFKVVADAANAMGSVYIEALFKQLPCTLVKLNFELDGSFPIHQPDPLVAANLKDLQKKVIDEKADCGLAPDGDGDRLFFVDEKGSVIPASCITALVAVELLKKKKGASILYDIRYTKTPQKIVEEHGGNPHVTKVGHAFITQAMSEYEGFFAGESSGHYYFSSVGNAEAQLPMIAIVLSVLSQQSKPLSEIIKSIKKSVESGEYNFTTDKAPTIIEEVKKHYIEGTLSTIDGIAIEYPTWRFGVRTSNTEPLMRLNLEADTETLMKEKRDELISLIIRFGATPHGH